ncbi:MAG TPA: helix-turn-helix domain-containing protein, partial [Bradyrhizobium sp.]
MFGSPVPARSHASVDLEWIDHELAVARGELAGRAYIREFMRRGVIIRTVICGLTFDGATRDPMQQAVRDALIAFMAATAQANVEVIKEAQRGGIALAKANEAETKYRGRKPSFTRDQFSTVCNMLDLSTGIGEIAATTGLSRQTIYRIRDDRASA